MLREFHAKYAPVTEPPFGGVASTRWQLMASEALEYQEAEAEEASDVPGIAKELGDIVYVAYGTALSYGIDLDVALRAVHASNMTKDMPLTLGGKAVKGPGYKPADMTEAVRNVLAGAGKESS